MKFNINDSIKVKLTDLGREIHEDQHKALFDGLPFIKRVTYTPPDEDGDGWSTWQAWVLMSVFGKHIGQGADLPFSPDVEIVERPVPQMAERKKNKLTVTIAGRHEHRSLVVAIDGSTTVGGMHVAAMEAINAHHPHEAGRPVVAIMYNVKSNVS